MRESQGQTIHLSDYKPPEYRVLTTELDIRLHPTQTRVQSKLLVERDKATQPGTAFHLDGDDVRLVGLSVDGKSLGAEDYQLNDTALIIETVPNKRKFEIEIETEINPQANTKLMGLYRSGGNYCTQCEAEGFRRITFFPDRPDMLSVFTTRIEADKAEAPILLGNGNPVKKGAAGKGRHYAIWHDPHPKPSYLFALVGGDLGSISKRFTTHSGRKVKLGIFVEKGKEAYAHYAMDSLVRSMRWDEDVFGCEYDLDVFNIVAVSDFNMGAMENKGLNIFNDKYVLADPETATDTDYANIEAIVAHEYFHNWTGNRITCRDWFQLCLKEGLTVFRDQEFSADQRSRAVKRIKDVQRLKADQFPEDAGPLAHAVRPDNYREINNFYTATVYEKGAELVRMIATIVGEDAFRAGMDLYLKRHDGQAATIEQFIACFEEAADYDLSQFFLWYTQSGTPLLNVSLQHDKAKQKLTVEFEQFLRPTPGQSHKKLMHIPQRIGLVGRNGETLEVEGAKGAELSNGVLHLTKRNHKVVFSGIAEKPVVSLNRGFTAPIEINFRQSTTDLGYLALNDSDGFARWQAFQTYANRLLIQNVKAFQADKPFQQDARFLEIAAHIAGMEDLEPAYRAAFLTLPNDSDIARIIGKNVDPNAIHQSWLHLSRSLGTALEPLRQDLLAGLKLGGKFSPDAQSAGRRGFAATLSRLGVLSRSKDALTEIEHVYTSAENMTDLFNALMTIVHYHPDKKLRARVLEDFHKRYRDNHIVLDKWFSVQASCPGGATVSLVRKLMKHEDFTFNNPNRLRSLIAVFAVANPSGFHEPKGRGYRLVADVIAKLDAINPQVAARLLTSFRSYKQLEPGRRQLSTETLRKLKQRNGLSTDTSDILDRTLNG